MDPIKLLRDAITAVPAVKYALGIAGIAAVVAIVLGLRLSPHVAVFGTLIVLGLMFILVVFSKYAGQRNVAGFLGPAKVLVWFYTLAVIATTILFMSSYFLHVPLDFRPGNTVPPPRAERAALFDQFGDESLKEGQSDDGRAAYEAASCIDAQDSGANGKLRDAPPASDKFVYSLRKVGRMLLDAKQFPCAEKLFREALEYDPRDQAQTHYLLGLALKEQKGKINEALNEFSQAEQLLNDVSPKLTCTLNGIYTWVGYLHQERGWALRSKALQSKDPLSKDYDAALDEFKKARPCIATDWVPTNIDEVRTAVPQASH